MKYSIIIEKRDFWYVFIPDIPEFIAWGETKSEALLASKNTLINIFKGYFSKGKKIPIPSTKGEVFIELPISINAKILLLNEFIEQGISKTTLAKMIMVSPQGLSRLLNLNHPTKIDTIQRALKVMGKNLELILE
ncbi:type II toxin-antitoxin system HicB family antitoxin [Escherichia coli]|nr:type II toxin-antitoxin system HicB family antitoxin [Escherichia coli]